MPFVAGVLALILVATGGTTATVYGGYKSIKPPVTNSTVKKITPKPQPGVRPTPPRPRSR